VNVTTENTLTGDSKHTNTAYLTFVAIDDDGKPVVAAPVRPVTAVEKKRFRDAARRREVRLLHRRRDA
jgi:acyl-CoA hydrolase